MPPLRPRLVVADSRSRIFEHPDLLMLCRQGSQWTLPRPDELMPLPDESELFLLPARRAVGLDPETGEVEVQEELAVAAFSAPAHTITAHPAYVADNGAPVLPLFAYGAVGFARGRFYVCAKRVDEDTRQIFSGITKARLEHRAKALMRRYPDNRLIQHLMAKCVLRYSCPAARNLALGRYEAPLPVSRACNARCVGCISQQEQGSKICATPQNRMSFTPTADEVLEVMFHHAREEKRPVFSFGQGCEGEPLTQAALLIEVVERFRAAGGRGTVNLNSNASLPGAVAALAEAGLDSLRVSMNSAREECYALYFRPQGYQLAQVRESIARAHAAGVFVSVNLLYFPGVSDTEEEIEALVELIQTYRGDFLQLRNLNIDPELYMELLAPVALGPSVGFGNFRRRLRKACPWLGFGYFNPYLGDEKETIMADTTTPPLRPQSKWQPDDEDSLDDDSMLEEPGPAGKKSDSTRKQSTWQPDDEDSLDDDSMA
ncbi:MAG: radical SAM protein [Deltaproteobacteria bacterium]|jgi:pyruvate-formate lyase-activating enzyme|nr:radical SAM protein [Deltaproteobacteria bacterium]